MRQSSTAPSPAYRLSAGRESKAKSPSPLTPACPRPQSRLVWLAVRAHQGTVWYEPAPVPQPRERNQQSSSVARATLPSSPSLSLALPPSLSAESAPTFSCSLPPLPVYCLLPTSLRGSANTRAHTHTHPHRPGNVFSSCEITLTTGHSRHTFVVVILPLRRHHLPRTMQASRDRDAMPVATSLVSRQCTVQHTIHSKPARFCHLYRLHGLAWVSHKTT